jgi:peroxiredoxin
MAAAFATAIAFSAVSGETLRPWEGGPTPPLALKTPSGRMLDLATLRGKVVLVNFWATWCAPCVEEMPALARLRDRFAPRGFEVIAVNQGEMPERVQEFMGRAGLDLPVLMDRNKEASRAWKVRALPTTFVVDPQGRIRLFAEGEVDTGGPLEEAIAALLPRARPTSAAK